MLPTAAAVTTRRRSFARRVGLVAVIVGHNHRLALAIAAIPAMLFAPSQFGADDAFVALAIPFVLHAQAPVASAMAVKWGPAPDFVPKGARFAVIQGDPSKSGVYTIRLRFPDNFRFPSHFHPTDEHLTRLAAPLIVGMSG